MRCRSYSNNLKSIAKKLNFIQAFYVQIINFRVFFKGLSVRVRGKDLGGRAGQKTQIPEIGT